MKIVSWEPEYSNEFKHMNIQWLEEFFWVEPHDEDVLGNPKKYIIDPGGNIFFIKNENEFLGCVALMKMENDTYELTKMAIKPAHRGKKIGQKLLRHTLDFAKKSGWKKLIIYSNRKLENAIHMYEKFGFEEILIEENNPYSRGDIKMQLMLS